MSTPPSTCVIDRVPDEVLIQILSDMLSEDSGDAASDKANSKDVVSSGELQQQPPFWLEHCVDLLRFRMTERTRGWECLPEDIKAAAKASIYKRHRYRERFGMTPHTTQTKHRQDWLIINSTCRRFRRLGKEAFFATKRIVLSATLLSRFRQGRNLLDLSNAERAEEYIRRREHIQATVRPEILEQDKPETIWGSEKMLCISREDQKLILDEARDIILLGTRLTTPSVLLGLPKLLSQFPKLRSCWLMLGQEAQTEMEAFTVHKADRESGDRISSAAGELRELLIDIGLNPLIELAFSLTPSYHWDEQEHHLTNDTFSLLRIKKTMMQRQRV